MGTLNGLIERIRSEEGYVEKKSNAQLDSKTGNKGSNNYTKYSRDVNNAGLMGCQGQPWCATFQFANEMYEFGKDQALKNWNMTSNTYTGYNCFATYNKFKSSGKVGMTPKLGALVIFNYSHMGRVIDIYSRNGVKYYSCVEGNTSSNLNDRNGGQVKIKERKFYDTSTIKGYCYIDYDVVEEQPKKSGWYQEDGGWRFYLGNTGDCVRDAWYKDGEKWYWFRNDGLMVHDVWYSYNGNWYYLGSDGAMKTGLQTIDGKWYYLNEDGTMATEPVLLTPDDNGALQYPGLLVNE